MSEKFNLEIISPEKILTKNQVLSVNIPAFEGEMTILPNHIPLITFLRPGIIKIVNSKDLEYFVEEGTVEFSNNNLIVLSSSIINVKELSKEKINQMIKECRDQLKDVESDKSNYIMSHKLEVLSRINL